MSATALTIVGMSGGVDSSVAAALLLRRGERVEGLFMKNWEEDDDADYCAAAEDLADAQAVCDRLGMVLHTVNFSAEYWDRVFETFLAEYSAGRTPNPDILCNKEIKFRAFLDHARGLGASHIATGHYARLRHRDRGVELLRGMDPDKDQSYFLCALNQQQLAQARFPIGELHKSEVRAMARELGLATHAKKDSTGICFIGERRFSDFLARYLPARPGEIRALDGTRLGSHHGLMYYTLGQRKGLGLGGRPQAEELPWYVVGKNLDSNTLLVAQGHDHPAMFSRSLRCKAFNWIAGRAPSLPLLCGAKTRYRQVDQPCRVSALGDDLLVDFDQPQRAVTPGQSVVLYADDVCLGGGIIESTTP